MGGSRRPEPDGGGRSEPSGRSMTEERPRPTSASGTTAPESLLAKTIETHMSMLFFVGDLVCKLRKPVQYGFLDFRLRTSRLDDCHREVALNRRLDPDVYLGVADVVMEGETLEHMVVMRRMPEARPRSPASVASPVGGCRRSTGLW